MNDSERDLSQFRKLSAYIMQDNQLHANLTVDEAMNVAAKLKIGEKKRVDREDIVRCFLVLCPKNTKLTQVKNF